MNRVLESEPSVSSEQTPEPKKDKKKIAAECFRKGNEAMEKGNFDYAVKMHRTAVMQIPDNLVFRQVLRGCEQKLYGNNKRGARFARMRLAGLRGRIRKARRKADWEAVDQAAEDGLTLNPWHPALNADVGEACSHLNRLEISEFALRIAVENDPDNAKFLRSLGEVYESRGSYKEAIDCWKRIEKLEPNKGEVRAKITGLEANAVMDRGGYEGAKSTQEVRRSAYDDYRPATEKHVPDKVGGPGVSQEADLQRAIRKSPTDKGLYVKLAEFYRQRKEFEKAGAAFQQALDVSGGDYNIREMKEDNDLDRMRNEIELARQVGGKDETSQKTLDAMKRELHLREIEVLSSKVMRYPMDLNLKFQLGLKYMKTKETAKAIQLFQQATADTRHEGEIRVALAECLISERQEKMALHQLDKSVEKLNPHDDPKRFCKAHYLRGRLNEKFGEREEAEMSYQEVLSVDYNYKDTRARLERLQRAGGGTGQSKDKPEPGDESE
jgi:tetratricopeptide (TPR) repeat protein